MIQFAPAAGIAGFSGYSGGAIHKSYLVAVAVPVPVPVPENIKLNDGALVRYLIS